MKYWLAEIAWHGDREAVLSADLRPSPGPVGEAVAGEPKAAVAGEPRAAEPLRLATSDTVRDIRLWDVSEGETSWAVEFVAQLGHETAVNVVRWSPDGTLLASADASGVVLVWQRSHSEAPDIFARGDDVPPNRETWIVRHRLRKHVEDVADLAWAPDSRRLATVSVDKTLLVWDLSTNKPLAAPLSFELFQQGVAWDPLDQVLASLGNDRALHLAHLKAKPAKLSRLKKVAKAPLRERREGEEEGKELASLFHDASLMAFVRRPAFSPCGQLLFAPAGQFWSEGGSRNATYVFTRRALRSAAPAPALVLPCPDKPTIAVRVCPTLFRLREDERSLFDLPHKVVWAVASMASIVVYSSVSTTPLAYLANIHLCPLTDMSWSADGLVLVASSKDGYCSFVSFSREEVGTPLGGPPSLPKDSSLLPVKGSRAKAAKAKENKEDAAEAKTPGAGKTKDAAAKTPVPRPSATTPKRTPTSQPKSILSFFKAGGTPGAPGDTGSSGPAASEDSDEVQVIPQSSERTPKEKTPKRATLKTLGPVSGPAEEGESSLHAFETTEPPDFSRTNFGPPPSSASAASLAAKPSTPSAPESKASKPRRVQFTTIP